MIDKMKRIKDFNIQYISGIWGDYASEDDKDGVFVLRSTEQKVNGDLKIISPAYIKTNYKSKNILKDGDLLITKSSGSRSHVGKCSYINKEVASFNYAFSNFMMGVRIKDKKLDSQYLCYCINSNFIKKQIEDSCTNVTLNNLNQKNVSNWLIPDFNMAKQNSIVFFLNKNIKVLNNIIEKYTKKIELLKEYKESLIYETVTKGLDANAEMKDSGVSWIEEIPSHWSLKRLKDFSRLKKGKQVEENEADGVYPYVNGGVNPSGYIDRCNTKGPVLIVSEGGASAGHTQIMDCDIWAGAHCYVLKTKCSLKYAYYILKGFNHHIISQKTGSAMPNLQKTRFQNLSFPYISDEEEQKKIIAYLDDKVNDVDKNILILDKKVALIEELKEAIIYEAVTGKIDVDTDGDKYLKMIDAL